MPLPRYDDPIVWVVGDGPAPAPPRSKMLTIETIRDYVLRGALDPMVGRQIDDAFMAEARGRIYDRLDALFYSGAIGDDPRALRFRLRKDDDDPAGVMLALSPRVLLLAGVPREAIPDELLDGMETGEW